MLFSRLKRSFHNAEHSARLAVFDKLLFLADGKLKAVGSHAALYKDCPEYRKMVDLQKLEEEGGAEE